MNATKAYDPDNLIVIKTPVRPVRETILCPDRGVTMTKKLITLLLVTWMVYEYESTKR